MSDKWRHAAWRQWLTLSEISLRFLSVSSRVFFTSGFSGSPTRSMSWPPITWRSSRSAWVADRSSLKVYRGNIHLKCLIWELLYQNTLSSVCMKYKSFQLLYLVLALLFKMKRTQFTTTEKKSTKETKKEKKNSHQVFLVMPQVPTLKSSACLWLCVCRNVRESECVDCTC